MAYSLKIICLLILTIQIFQGSSCYDQETVEYYEDLVAEEEKRSIAYDVPKNAYRFRPESYTIKSYGCYDFVVIGAGSAGSVVANRLSEISNWRVLVLEAGEFGNNFTDIPNLESYYLHNEYNWGFATTPQKHFCFGMVNNQCPYSRGCGVGGTTLINGNLYSRGHPIDAKIWADMGNPSWAYDEVLPYFKKSENFTKNDPLAVADGNYHGKGGYLNVEYRMPNDHPNFLAYIRANQELGYNLMDYNVYPEIGVSQIQSTTRRGSRLDTGKAFVKSVINKRPNLTVLTKSYVTKINIDDNKVARSVIFSRNGQLYMVKVKREIILCAGAVSSPQILLLSGIGPRNHLHKLGISVVQELEVGSNYSEQPQYKGLVFSSNGTQPSASSKREIVIQYLDGNPMLYYAGVGFFKSKLEKTENYPDFEHIFIPKLGTTEVSQAIERWSNESFDALFGKLNIMAKKKRSMFSIIVNVLRPKSRGTIRLKSSDPYEYPLIDPNLFSVQEDFDYMYEGIKLGLKFAKTDAMKKIDAKFETKPIKGCEKYKFMSKKYWYCSIQYFAGHNNHPVASCPMGPDPSAGAVVDNDLKVHGIKKIRVADASVIPIPITGHTNAPAIMVGEKVSDLLKTDYAKYIESRNRGWFSSLP